MNAQFWLEFQKCFNRIADDTDVRAVVVSGVGEHFSAGLDLADTTNFDAIGEATRDVARRAFRFRKLALAMQESFSAVERCPQPVIAAIHGACVGGAVDLACACDVRLCSEDARFCIAEVKVGLAADVGTLQRMPKIVGNESLCRELAFTGRTFGAAEAAAMGFVSRVVAAAGAAAATAETVGSPALAAVAAATSRRAEVVAASLLMASEIARQSPVAVFGTKRNLLYARDHGVRDGLEYAATWSGAALQAADLGVAMGAAAGKSASSSLRRKNNHSGAREGAGAGAGSLPRFSKFTSSEHGGDAGLRKPKNQPNAARRGCLAAIGALFLLSLWGGRRIANRMLLRPENAPPVSARASGAGWRNGQGWSDASAVAKVELDRPRQFGGALVLKSERIVFCPIQKVACTEWLKVFRWIDGQPNWTEPRHVKHGLLSLAQYGVEGGNTVLNSPSWLKLAVVREPAERLLSCFLQKCTKWNMKGEYGNCPYLELWPDLFGRERFPAGVPSKPDEETLSVVVDAFNERGRGSMFASYVSSITRRVKRNPCGQNGHWSPQFCHCSLDKTAPVYHIVGWHNMTEEASAAIVPMASSKKRGLEIAEFLDDRMKSNHERHGKKTSAGSSTQESYTKEMLDAVHEAYAKDYELFSKYWEQPE
eukprot:g6418.t2